MKRLVISTLLAVSCLLTLAVVPASAQKYYFSVDEEFVHVYWESDGSMQIEYIMVFTNDRSASPIEFVDIGLPNRNYDRSAVYGWIDDQPITHVGRSEYVTPGIEFGLQSNAIQPGATGEFKATIGRVERVLFPDSDDAEYASARFAPTWFGKQYVLGTTDLTVAFHLPPGVQPEEPRWHASPGGWPDEPETGLDADDRIVYRWRNPSANAYTKYVFGASFPRRYVPAGAVRTPVPERPRPRPRRPSGGGGPPIGAFVFVLFLLAAFGPPLLRAFGNHRRKLAYLPPKLSIEGHGIKRGLTAVEAAVLLETPLDRILSMILFSVVKKGAARVVSEDPIRMELITPLPKGLRAYEQGFLEVMVEKPHKKRRTGFQRLMISLVRSVQKKMKGFSLRETNDYYRSIIKKAWQQVEAATTPEVRSKFLDEGLEWAMLDRDFDDRTRRVFRTGIVHVPDWWVHYRPSTVSARPSTTAPTGVPGAAGPSVSLPHLPGADFAANIVSSVQNAAANLVSNVMSFTGGVTEVTNPPPPPSRSGSFFSGGGSGCACACACAGCACACAGGGR